MTFTTSAAVPRASLSRNLRLALAGRVAFVLSQFGILVVVARIGSPVDLGAITVATAIVTPLFFLTSMGMREVHTVDDLDHFTRADYVILRILAGGLAIFLTIAVLAAFYGSARAELWGAVIAFSFVKFFHAQLSLNHGIFQRVERLDYVALSNFARGGFALTVFATAFWSTRNLPVALAFEALSLFVSYLIVDRALLARIGALTPLSALREVRLRKVLRLGWWLLPVGLSLWFLRAGISAPPIILERHVELATVGVFGALAYLYSALSMFANTLGSVASPRLRRAYSEGNRSRYLSLTIRLSLLAMALGLLCVLGAWLIGDQIIGLIFGPEYQRRHLLIVIMLASTFMIFGGPITAAINAGHAFRRRILITGTGFSVAVVASLFLVPRFAEFGAAWALVAMSASNAILNILVFVWVLKRIPAQKIDTRDRPDFK